MNKIFTLILIAFLIFSCTPNQRNKKSSHPLINFVNSDASKVIDSLVPYIVEIPKSNDTIFLGFRFGMTKKEFRNHIYKLRKDGFTLDYEKDLRFTNPVVNYTFNIGSGYTFITDISCEKYSTDEVFTGTGKYYLRPSYGGTNGKLYKLSVMTKESWNNTYFEPCKWLERKLYDEYKTVPSVFREYSGDLVGNDFGFFKEKGNTFVYDGGMIFDVVWQTKKSFFGELLVKKKVKEMEISNSKKDIKI